MDEKSNIRVITLDWKGFSNISSLALSDVIETGIYIWGFTIDGVFIPYYVGIADNVTLRIQEHISFLISGKYSIFHRDSLKSFNTFKDKAEQSDLSHGRIYIPNWPINFKYFLDRRNELLPHIDYMIETFTFTYATVDSETISAQDLKEIEKICINQIGKEKLANTRGGFSDKFKINHIGNSILQNIFLKKDN